MLFWITVLLACPIEAIIGENIVRNEYNGEGLRVSKSADGKTWKYAYEYDKVTMEKETVNGTTTTTRNVHGLNLISRDINGAKAFYMYNGHHDVLRLVTSAGTTLAEYYYDAFGQSITDTDTNGVNPYRYAGYFMDREVGLYYLNARFYDVGIARFMQEDTYRGEANDPLSLNLYTYCYNNPIRYWDPTGHVVTQADITRAYTNNPPDVAKQIVNDIAKATDAYNNAKTDDQRETAHKEADRLRGIETNENGTSSGKGGQDLIYLDTSDKAALDKANKPTSSSGGGGGGGSSGSGGKPTLNINPTVTYSHYTNPNFSLTPWSARTLELTTFSNSPITLSYSKRNELLFKPLSSKSIINPFISTLSPIAIKAVEAIMNIIEEFQIPPWALKSSEYLLDSLEQMAWGELSDKTTLLGTTGQIALSAVNLDLISDLESIASDFKNWENSWSHFGKTVFDFSALLPGFSAIAGSIKYSDEVADAADVARKFVAKQIDSFFDTTDNLKDVAKSADDITDAIKGAGNVKIGSFDDLPNNAKNAYNGYETNGWKGTYSGQTPGTAAGRSYRNYDAKLPITDGFGNPITYKEFDVNNYVPGSTRDAQRFITGSDGSKYYTNDHYSSFTKIK